MPESYSPELERADELPKDGIGEEDNPIPAWWWITFGITVVFALFYIPFYLFSGWSQESQYAAEVEVMTAQAEAVRAELPTTNPFRGDTAAIADGKETWTAICVACHKPDGSGLVGPSVVDPYWKYGNDDVALYETVAKGRPLGMPPWETQLGSEKIWKVLAYMETLPKSDKPGVGSPEAEAGGAGR